MPALHVLIRIYRRMDIKVSYYPIRDLISHFMHRFILAEIFYSWRPIAIRDIASSTVKPAACRRLCILHASRECAFQYPVD